MKTLSLILIVCFIGSAHLDASANQFVDQTITAMRSQKGLDPLVIEEHKMDIKPKIGNIHLHGHIETKNTRITGLSHIRRIGDAQIGNDKGAFSAKLHLGDSNVKITSDVHLTLDKLIHPNLKVEADIGDIAVQFSVKISADGHPAVDLFDIDEFKHVKFHVHGLKALDPLIDVIADAFVAIANTQARHLLTNLIRPVLDQQLKHLKMGGN